MSVQESWTATSEEENSSSSSSSYDQSPFHKSGFDPSTGIYHSLHQLGDFQIPTEDGLSTAKYALSEFPQPDHAETKIAFIDLATNHRITYAQLNRSIRALASGLYHGLGVRKGDVVFVLSPNSILYPTISLAIFSIGAILSPAVPPVVLGLVKYASKAKCDLSSLRRVGSGAAPLSKELSEGFREKFPWVELRQGYGLTESSGAGTFFASDEDAKAHPASCGRLVPTFCGKVVNTETGLGLPPGRAGEVWIKSPTIMKGYLGNEAATVATLEADGWLKTGDLGYFDDDGFLHIVDRIKELIKHNGYQVAPAELEDLLLSHPQILDAAVIPIEDEEAGQIPMAYVVREADSELSEEQVIQFVASQVAAYKKVRRVGFISAIPKSAAGKILRKELVAHSQQQIISKL